MKNDDLMYNDMDPADGFDASDMNGDDENNQNEYEKDDTINDLDAFEDEDM